MKLSNFTVENFRGLKECTFSFERLNSIVGANNSGKSSLLLAIKLFFSRAKLELSEYYDQGVPVRFSATFSDIAPGDFLRIRDVDHRDRISGLVSNGVLSFAVQYSGGGRAEVLCKKLVPIDARLSDAIVAASLTGARGAAANAAMVALLPEHAERFVGVTSQAAAKAVVETLIGELAADQLHEVDAPLTTGIPASLADFLPEPILIPAVKDVRDELKTTESSTFGKLVSILLGLVEGTAKMQEVIASLDQLHSMLNLGIDADGFRLDARIQEIRDMETVLGGFLRESFPGISLQVEVPRQEIRSIFSTAKITLDDGVSGDVESKGDGLKRSVIFALLRTYVSLNRPKSDEVQDEQLSQPYLFLFEEPELYLYPSAQKVLFEALSKLSTTNQVCLTTHSPAFLSPIGTGSFIKLYKPRGRASGELHPKPWSRVVAINLVGEVSQRDAFQLICYENNAAGFFAEKVVLVEGDADVIFFDHAFRVLIAESSAESLGISFIRLQGKSNISRYKSFFERFGVDVFAILDRDFLLEGIEKVELPADARDLHSTFLRDLNVVAQENGLTANLNGADIKALVRTYTFKQRYLRLKEIVSAIREGQVIGAEQIEELELLFATETVELQRAVLDDLAIPPASMALLVNRLAELKFFVLSRGAVEAYYPADVSGRDKPTQSLDACIRLNDRASYVAVDDGAEVCEIERILKAISG